MVNVNLKTIDLQEAKKEKLPSPWPELERNNFHQDLLERAYVHNMWAKKMGFSENAQKFLTVFGDGFLRPFQPEQFIPQKGSANYDLKYESLLAISEMSEDFGDRVSAVVWRAFAHLATREDPGVEKSILKEADTLPDHYAILDTCLHAIGKVYSFMLHVNSGVFLRTGKVVNHNCDCNCSLISVSDSGTAVDFSIKKSDYPKATQSLFSHMLAESVLISEMGLPFSYGISEEAKILFSS